MNKTPDFPWKPRFAVWELTLACNMRCLHCGSYAGKPREDELSLERCLTLADELAELGLERITLSGGEPFLRKDWDKIAQRLMDNGVMVGAISNGWYVEENIEKCSKLGKWDLIAMSLDGLRQTHDAFRRMPGSFDRILSSFKALRRKKIRTACITCVSRYNLRELDTIHDILVSHGVSAWQVQPLFVAGRLRERQEMMLDIRELFEVAKFIARKRKVSPIEVFPADGVGYHSRLESQIRSTPWGGCQAGMQVVGIEANGNIKGCLSLNPEMHKDNPFVEGNVKNTPLRDIWFKPGSFAYNREFDISKVEGFCKECEYLAGCHCGCTAEAYYSTTSTYCNPYCMYKEVSERGEPEYQTTVPMTEEFEQELSRYYQSAGSTSKQPFRRIRSKLYPTS